jgi:hypothetical protein
VRLQIIHHNIFIGLTNTNRWSSRSKARRSSSTCAAFSTSARPFDITDKEVIDLFKNGLYHDCTFEDFDRRRPSSITNLKDMITSWADEEDKANAKYDSISSKSKNNMGSNNNNNEDQGVATTTTTRVLTASAS